MQCLSLFCTVLLCFWFFCQPLCLVRIWHWYCLDLDSSYTLHYNNQGQAHGGPREIVAVFVFSLNQPTGLIQSLSRNVRLSVCLFVYLRHRMQFVSRPLIGQHRWHDQFLGFHWCTGAAVQPLNGQAHVRSTIERPWVELFNQMIADFSA